MNTTQHLEQLTEALEAARRLQDATVPDVDLQPEGSTGMNGLASDEVYDVIDAFRRYRDHFNGEERYEGATIWDLAAEILEEVVTRESKSFVPYLAQPRKIGGSR